MFFFLGTKKLSSGRTKNKVVFFCLFHSNQEISQCFPSIYYTFVTSYSNRFLEIFVSILTLRSHALANTRYTPFDIMTKLFFFFN